jgi:hypothetical protein
MTLQEALKAKKLLRLIPFKGFKPCGLLTGRYFYETVLDREAESDIKVEISEWFGLRRYWVPLVSLKEVKIYEDKI